MDFCGYEKNFVKKRIKISVLLKKPRNKNQLVGPLTFEEKKGRRRGLCVWMTGKPNGIFEFQETKAKKLKHILKKIIFIFKKKYIYIYFPKLLF